MCLTSYKLEVSYVMLYVLSKVKYISMHASLCFIVCGKYIIKHFHALKEFM